MKRYFLKSLIDWKSRNSRKPLIVRGARQVGKSHVIREFGKKYFADCLELNFEKSPELKDFFISQTPQKTIQLLETLFGKKIHPSETLLFLDEIQAAPEILPKLRYFYEDMPEFPIICAGSLLDFILAQHDFSMPVGRIEYLHLGPLNFEEFLLALGETALLDYLENYKIEEAIPKPLHNKLIEHVKTFCLVGGMPESVKTYAASHSFSDCGLINQNILATYQDDFAKYGRKIDYALLRNTFRAVPNLIAEKTKYVKIDPHARAKDVAKSLDLLGMARICTKVFHSSSNGVPLRAQIDPKTFKLLFVDVGLVSAACGLNLLDYEKAGDVQLVNQGKISEQFIGQHLLYAGPPYQEPELFYWTREQRNAAAEVDYVISLGAKTIPIEVKSGKTGSLKSLHLFVFEKNATVGVRFNSEPPLLTKVKTSLPEKNAEFSLISLPFYLVGQMPRLCSSLSTQPSTLHS
jgi:predicted AAA+ superfamily ATPase